MISGSIFRIFILINIHILAVAFLQRYLMFCPSEICRYLNAKKPGMLYNLKKCTRTLQGQFWRKIKIMKSVEQQDFSLGFINLQVIFLVLMLLCHKTQSQIYLTSRSTEQPRSWMTWIWETRLNALLRPIKTAAWGCFRSREEWMKWRNLIK